MINEIYIPYLFIIGVLITLLGYFFYLKDTFSGKTKPHIFTWLIGGLGGLVSFIIQLYEGAGYGGYLSLVTSISCILIAVVSLKRGEKDIRLSDKVAFLSAIVAIILWTIIDNAIYSAIILVSATIFGFYPTIRKSYYKPYEETLTNYILAIFKFGIGFLTLAELTATNILLQFSYVIINLAFVIMVIIRRKSTQLTQPAN